MSTVLYTVDLSAQANQTCTASGAYTIDGLTWYAKGSLSVSSQVYTRNLVNGSGLSIRRTSGPGSAIIGSNGDLNFPHWFLPFSQVPGYDAAIPMLVRARFNMPGNVVDPLVGIVDTTNDGVGLRAAQRAKDYMTGPSGSGSASSSMSFKLGAASLAVGASAAGLITNVQWVAGVYNGFCAGYDIATSEQRTSSGMPASDLTAKPGVLTVGNAAAVGARSNPGLFFGINDGLSNTTLTYLVGVQFVRIGAPPLPPPDTTPPTVSTLPVVMTPINQGTAIQVVVGDAASAVKFAMINCYLPGLEEPVYDGQQFRAFYGSSTGPVVGMDGRWTFVVQRDGGWPLTNPGPFLRVKAVDAAGNVA